MDNNRYGKLDENPIELEEREGLFDVPTMLEGKSDYGPRKYLMIYFDDEESYQTVLDVLENKASRVRCHPAINTGKLVEMCRKEKGLANE